MAERDPFQGLHREQAHCGGEPVGGTEGEQDAMPEPASHLRADDTAPPPNDPDSELREDHATLEERRILYIVPARTRDRFLWDLAAEWLHDRGESITVNRLHETTGISRRALRRWRDGVACSILEKQFDKFCRAFDWEPDAVDQVWVEELTSAEQRNASVQRIAEQNGIPVVDVTTLTDLSERELAAEWLREERPVRRGSAGAVWLRSMQLRNARR